MPSSASRAGKNKPHDGGLEHAFILGSMVYMVRNSLNIISSGYSVHLSQGCYPTPGWYRGGEGGVCALLQADIGMYQYGDEKVNIITYWTSVI
jgi:hypothetical protein